MADSVDPFAPSNPPPRLAQLPAESPLVLPIIQERAVITRGIVESGRVRLLKEVHQEDELINLTLQHEEVQVQRLEVNRFVADEAPLPVSRHEGDTLIIPVLREVVVTRVLLVEEIHVTKRQVDVPHTESITLRREEVRVERHPSTDAATNEASSN